MLPIISLAAAAPAYERVRYKVWVQIERITEDRDGNEEFQDIGLPDPVGEHATLRAAQEHVRALPGWYPDGSDNRLTR